MLAHCRVDRSEWWIMSYSLSHLCSYRAARAAKKLGQNFDISISPLFDSTNACLSNICCLRIDCVDWAFRFISRLSRLSTFGSTDFWSLWNDFISTFYHKSFTLKSFPNFNRTVLTCSSRTIWTVDTMEQYKNERVTVKIFFSGHTATRPSLC